MLFLIHCSEIDSHSFGCSYSNLWSPYTYSDTENGVVMISVT